MCLPGTVQMVYIPLGPFVIVAHITTVIQYPQKPHITLRNIHFLVMAGISLFSMVTCRNVVVSFISFEKYPEGEERCVQTGLRVGKRCCVYTDWIRYTPYLTHKAHTYPGQHSHKEHKDKNLYGYIIC